MDPFRHLRVLDLSPNRIGAQVSQFFADFGADVVWVEPPGGSAMRREAAYPFWCRGKRSISLDLHNGQDLEVVRRLATQADVLIETCKPGELDAIGLSHDSLAEVNPGLIHTSITAFGRQGPYVDVPVDEDLVLAKLGVNYLFGRMSPYDAPPFVTAPFAAFSASQVALHGTLTALYERSRSGRGQLVEANLAQGFATLDPWGWFEYLIAQRWPDAYSPTEAYDDQGCPISPLIIMLIVALTADGHWLQFASVGPHLFAAKMKALGLDWMFADEEWQGIPVLSDADKRMELWTRMLEAAKQKTLADWHEVFEQDHNVFAEQFRNGPAVLEHPQLIHDQMVADVPDAERGPVRQPGALVKAGTTPARLGRSAPALDQHRQEILAELSAAADGPAPVSTAPASSASNSPGGLPLAGVKILELAVLFAAPHGTTMLTDLGARVIKVEQMSGDVIRAIIPFPEAGGAKVMQGKESICVDLSTEEGRALVQAIIKDVDVVVQGFRAGAVQRMELDYQSLKKLNPDLIYVNAPGYGVDGPFGDRPAFAPSIGAASGIPLANVGTTVPEHPDLTIEQIRDGMRRLSAANTSANAQADGFAALGVASAILFGLVARDAGAGGQELFSSMLNTGAHAMSAHTVTYDGAPPPPTPDDQLRGLGPLHRIYEAEDGYAMLAASGDDDWDRLVAALGEQDGLGSDDRFVDSESRTANAEALREALGRVFALRPAAAWETELLAHGIGCMELHLGFYEEMMLAEDFGRASGYIVDVVHPTFEEHPRLAPFVRFSRSATQAQPGVLAGQSTDAILAEVGHSADEIAGLRERGIVG
ncbi:MAG: CoA transferase [bacterium]|nr:CoA transferase [bacterium]